MRGFGVWDEISKGLFGAKKPKISAPTPMPDPEDPAAIEARRRRQAELLASTGRGSTRLSGGASYNGDYGRSGL